MDKDNRHYGFKHISADYSWMTPGWIEELVKHEPDEEVCSYVTDILTDLTTPEKSRLESPTDSLDCIEDYWINRLTANSTKFEDDAVYKWMIVSQDFFAKNDAFELSYNIQRFIEIVKEQLETVNSDTPYVDDGSGLPF